VEKVTMKDVAKEAGVSYTTVSHVINGTRFVKPETEKRVQDALEKLDYRPNSVARSLRIGSTKTIGLIVPDASNLFFAEISRKIEDLGFKLGYSVILGNSDNDSKKQTNYINTLIAKQVDGVIFIATGGDVEVLESLHKNNIPVVIADRDVPLEFADVVLLDNETAGYEATKHLLDLGHKCIACITGPNYLSSSSKRVIGYKRALKEFGIPVNPELVRSSNFRFDGGMSTMTDLLESDCKPTAVFVLNDMMAIGAMAAIRKAGMSIPEDFSIVGFDDIELSSITTPPLTTIAQPFDNLAKQTIELLVGRIQGDCGDDHKRIILSAELIERESTSEKGNR